MAASGLVAAAYRDGWSGGLDAALGLVVAFAALVFAWRRRWIGGGDVKLAAGAAAWVGLNGLPRYAIASALAAGVLAIISYAASSSAARREIRANLALAGRRVSAPLVDSSGNGRAPVPAGAAFAIGAVSALWLGG